MLTEAEIRNESIEIVAKKMLIAARTAPKGKGVDNLLLGLATGDDIKMIAEAMRMMAREGRAGSFYNRDADNLEKSDALVLIGTKIAPLGLKFCGLCGFSNCDEKQKFPKVPCSFNTGDLGIAVGSAVSIAMDNRVDNRIMFSIGKAAKELKLLGEEADIIYGIPLSSNSKNIFFDRG